METSTSENSQSHSKCFYCTRLLPIVFAILFVALALTFAIIYTGLHHEHVNPNYINATFTTNNNNKSVILTNVSQYPFISALLSLKPTLFLCSTVIMTERYVLARANCFSTTVPNYFVRIGSNYWNKYGCLYPVERFFIYKGYETGHLEDNLALVKTQRTMKFSKNAQPVQIAEESSSGQNGILLGWGKLHIRVEQDLVLLEEKVRLRKIQECSTLSNMSTKLICIDYNSCDSGLTGVLLLNNKVFGLWTYGLFCNQKFRLFTEIRYYDDWITNITSIK